MKVFVVNRVSFVVETMEVLRADGAFVTLPDGTRRKKMSSEGPIYVTAADAVRAADEMISVSRQSITQIENGLRDAESANYELLRQEGGIETVNAENALVDTAEAV